MDILETRTKLVSLRKEMGMSQLEMAEKMGVRQNAVSALETRPTVGWNALEAYAAGLGRRLSITIKEVSEN